MTINVIDYLELPSAISFYYYCTCYQVKMLMFYNDQITNVTFVGKRRRYIVNTYRKFSYISLREFILDELPTNVQRAQVLS